MAVFDFGVGFVVKHAGIVAKRVVKTKQRARVGYGYRKFFVVPVFSDGIEKVHFLPSGSAAAKLRPGNGRISGKREEANQDSEKYFHEVNDNV